MACTAGSWFKQIAGILLIICFIPAAQGARSGVDSNVQSVFEAAKKSVVQIRILLRDSQLPSSLGSGFYVSSNGLIITNYHVVAENALDPKNYKIEYLGKKGDSGKLTLLAVDVLHDLALLQRNAGRRTPFLRFNAALPRRGEILYSLGNPNELGLSITEGVNNGLQEHTFYDTLHFTGPINAGMSGGPVLNVAGKLVGVNDATMGESRGFLEPTRYARELLTRWHANPVVPDNFTPEIIRQLKQHSAAVINRLTLKPLPVHTGEKYSVPDTANDFIRCWASDQNDNAKFYKEKMYVCFSEAGVYVNDDINIGHVMYMSNLIQSDKLDAIRFARVLEKINFREGPMADEGKPKYLGNYNCEDTIVNFGGMKVKTVACMRAYLNLPGLYDFRFKAVTLRPEKRAMVYRLILNGFTREDGIRMVSQYMDAIEWKK